MLHPSLIFPAGIHVTRFCVAHVYVSPLEAKETYHAGKKRPAIEHHEKRVCVQGMSILEIISVSVYSCWYVHFPN